MRRIIVRLFITVALFALIAWYIDLRAALGVMLTASPIPLLAALLMQTSSTLFSAWRWGLIMHALDFDRPMAFFIKVYFIGGWFNQALPSSIGGDAVRVLEVGRGGFRKRHALAGVFIDRAVGVFGLLVLNLLAVNLLPNGFPGWLNHLINLIAVGGCAGFLAMILLRHLPWLGRFRVLSPFDHLGRQAHRLYSRPMRLVGHTLLSMGAHLCSIMAVWFIARAIGLPLHLHHFLIAMPAVFLLTFVPVSLAGWGIREGAMVGIFLLVGADKDHILAVSILYGLICIVSSLPGGLFWLDERHHRKPVS
ncbi:lysylphosphatidylglycerol synthase transmembrane domain-containing protein [Alcanivorax sp.]|uniref:lysylphosphatidylglycerol synthase transmembrane domain-containing protein n=1 Tax=Alcanivorax sp. TaxID=1872427 RepID=UPI0025840A27|nr:lysylphosphatidylglycerol synthase transmembrane domain-containing protein [Alcanivorax sp.]